MNDATFQERWVYATESVAAADRDDTAVDGFRPRTPSGPYTGHIVEEFTASGDTEKKLQPTGETLTFWSYWTGQLDAGSLIRVRQDTDGRYKVWGGECAT